MTPAAGPLYGDLVARLVGARLGRSAKVLVLDLDDTLWGGTIGEDGLSGIVVGQGSAAGESFLALQAYARDLARRGILLAICSKNDPETARRPFLDHPDMLLRLADFAAFVANWDDKATNLRRIARTSGSASSRSSSSTTTRSSARSCASTCRWWRCRKCPTSRPSSPAASPMPATSRRWP